jgi:serine/threonine-protein kinase
MAALRHPNLVAVYDVGEEQGRPFLAMELIEGRPLSELIPPGGLPLERVTAVVIQLAAALDALHAAGFVHRDVKAENVLVGNDGRVVLSDLGIALSPSGTRYTEAGFGMGTPESAAPEQIGGGPVGSAADVYALGVLTYQMLAGRPLFAGDTARVLYAHAHLAPPALRGVRPGLPDHVYAAIEAALAKDPARRPASAGRFAELLAGTRGPTAALPDSASRAAPAHAEGHGDGMAYLRIEAGTHSLHIEHRAWHGGLFRVTLLDDAGRPPDLLAAASGTYTGIATRRFPRAGTFAVVVRASGRWAIDVV